MRDNIDKNEDSNKAVWYAIRTFNCQEMRVSEYLKKQGFIHFVPMAYTMNEKANEKPKKELVPIIHNMLFMQRTVSEEETLEKLKDCLVPLSILKKEKSTQYYGIPDDQMIEFRAMCDPSHSDTRYVTQQEAEAEPGKEVRIIHGSFKGMIGKLVRCDNDYFIVKTLVGIGVMLHVSKWYCEVIG
jgi:transcription antitermination factor NusG